METPASHAIDGSPLPLAQAIAAVGAVQRSRPPRILHQYWDFDPPREISKLLRQCQKVCRRAGIEPRLWDDAAARVLLADGFPPMVAQAYDTAPHASMRSDIFRMAVLLRHGGVYLDADMALRTEAGALLWSSFTDVLLFKWNHEDRGNVPTWCLGFQPGHPMAEAALMHMSAKMLRGVQADLQKALRHALAHGPGALTEAVGGWIAVHGAVGVTVLDVSDAYKMVQNGPDYLRAPLR
jgi:mannosyltransferase OCH1-like enzyme